MGLMRLGSAMTALALLLSACGSGPDYYMLPAQGRPPVQYPAPVSGIVVTEISLPSYADALEIAALQENGALKLERGVSWADEPRRALTRHLAAALAARLVTQVTPDPWPGFSTDPDLRVDVAADRLIGSEGGGVDFEGQYFIVRSSTGSIFASERFRINVPPQGAGYGGLAPMPARSRHSPIRLLRASPGGAHPPPERSGSECLAGEKGRANRAVVEIVEFAPDRHPLRQRGQADAERLQLVGNVMGGGLPIDSGIEREDHLARALLARPSDQIGNAQRLGSRAVES